MLEGSHNQNGSSCQHSGKTFNFVGFKLKAKTGDWLSGARGSPCLDLNEGVVVLGSAWNHSSKPNTASMVHASAVSGNQSRVQVALQFEMWGFEEPHAAAIKALSCAVLPTGNLSSAWFYCHLQCSVTLDLISSLCVAYLVCLSLPFILWPVWETAVCPALSAALGGCVIYWSFPLQRDCITSRWETI